MIEKEIWTVDLEEEPRHLANLVADEDGITLTFPGHNRPFYKSGWTGHVLSLMYMGTSPSLPPSLGHPWNLIARVNLHDV